MKAKKKKSVQSSQIARMTVVVRGTAPLLVKRIPIERLLQPIVCRYPSV